MAIFLGAATYDLFLAPEITSFTSADLPDLKTVQRRSKSWIKNHRAHSMSGARYTDTWRQTAIVFLFRAQAVLSFYCQARVLTLRYLREAKRGKEPFDIYFDALAAWEVVIWNMQMAVEVVQKVSPFEEGPDATRLRKMVNRIKHVGDDIQSRKQGPKLTVPMWLTNEGLHSRVASLSYNDIVDSVLGMDEIAEILQNPGTAEKISEL
jgi:hypothetical protein